MSSVDRLRNLLADSGEWWRLYTTDPPWRMQVDCTCQLLDVVDGVCDEVTAGLITNAIYRQLSGEGAAEADRRVREARETLERLTRELPSPPVFRRRWKP